MKIQKTSVKALFIKDGKALFVKDPKGNWELPGGCIEFGEKPQEALRRELQEELGVNDVEIGDVATVFDIQQIQHDSNEYQYVVIVFKCKANLSQLVLSQEHLEHIWLEPSCSSDYPMKPGYKTMLNNQVSHKLAS